MTEGQTQFASPADSATVQAILSGEQTHDLHAGLPSNREDTALTAIMKESGRDRPPQLVEAGDVDLLAADGWYVCYRGVGDAGHAEQFRTGAEMYNGAGTYGNGSYFTSVGRVRNEKSARDGATMYASQNDKSGQGGAVLRMAFPPGAKIGDHATVMKERNAALKAANDRLSRGELSRDQHRQLCALLEDVGRFAALNNYDAVRVPHEGFLLVLNRAKCVVERG